MSNWPAQLQQKMNVESFEYHVGKTTTRTEMDVGMPKVRSRFTSAIDTYTCSIFIDFDDIDVFQTFYKTTLNNGANRFTFDDPFTNTPAEFRFLDDPTIRPLGGRTFQLSMTWEKMP